MAHRFNVEDLSPSGRYGTLTATEWHQRRYGWAVDHYRTARES